MAPRKFLPFLRPHNQRGYTGGLLCWLFDSSSPSAMKPSTVIIERDELSTRRIGPFCGIGRLDEASTFDEGPAPACHNKLSHSSEGKGDT